MNTLKDRILYEDNHLIIVNKLGGELVQGDITGDETLGDLVKDYLKKTYNKQGNVYLGIPHRLDRPTSGLVIFAKTEKALVRLNALFKTNTVKKTYWAIVDKVPNEPEGTLIHSIIRDTKANKSVALPVESKRGKLAKLDYKLIAASKTYYLLEVLLHTGRHHQIRAQFAAIGLHIKGDLKYGFPRSNPDGGICLHARSITFEHPVRKEEITVVADPPSDNLWTAFLNQI